MPGERRDDWAKVMTFGVGLVDEEVKVYCANAKTAIVLSV